MAQTLTKNVILVAGSAKAAADFDSLIEAFTVINPIKCFILIGDDIDKPVITTREICHRPGNNPDDSVCSEVTEVVFRFKDSAFLPSLLRSQMLPGKVVEGYIADDLAITELFPVLDKIVDTFIFDSSKIRRGLHSVGLISERTHRVLDIAWLRLSVWRDAIRQQFDRMADATQSALLTTHINITGGAVEGKLLAGWIASQLRMTVDTRTDTAVVVRSTERDPITFSFVPHPDGLQSVEFKQKEGTIFTISRKDLSLTISDDGSAQSAAILLSRHFAVGQSQKNFLPAVWSALQMI